MVVRERRGQNLDRDFAIQLGVLGPKNFAHPASAQRTNDLVVAQARARCQWHRLTIDFSPSK